MATSTFPPQTCARRGAALVGATEGGLSFLTELSDRLERYEQWLRLLLVGLCVAGAMLLGDNRDARLGARRARAPGWWRASAGRSGPVLAYEGRMTVLEQVLRLASASLAGGALGLNRRVRGKSAGLRTHALVSLGAAVVVLAADLYVSAATAADRGAVTRVIQGVVSGIGFIGAGAILKGGAERSSGVRGLTTAASIWLAAAVGAASGAGFGAMALVAVVIAYVVLVGGTHVEVMTRRLFEARKHVAERRVADRRAPRGEGAVVARPPGSEH